MDEWGETSGGAGSLRGVNPGAAGNAVPGAGSAEGGVCEPVEPGEGKSGG